MLLAIGDNWEGCEQKHNIFLTSRIDKHLKIKSSSRRLHSQYAREFLGNYKEEIVKGGVADFQEVIEEDRRIKNSISRIEYLLFLKDIRSVFNYDAFTKKSDDVWNAYDLTAHSKYKICPYCSQSYAFTVVANDGSFRPTLDHYYSKEKYPYLALSINNLIPSCFTCNSNLKGRKDFYEEKHLHPLFDDETVKFKLSTYESDDLLDAIYNPKLFLSKGYLEVHPTTNQIVCNSINTFLLKHRFRDNLSVFVEFVIAKNHFTASKLAAWNDLVGSSIPEETALQFDVQNYKNKLLGSILRDLYYQFDG